MVVEADDRTLHVYIENPFQAAQTFIETNDLPQSYLEEIANFVIKNAQVVTLGAETVAHTNVDPFTGTMILGLEFLQDAHVLSST